MLRAVAFKAAAVEDVSEFLLFWGGGGCDVAVYRAVRIFGKQGTALKVCGGASEDKVDVALDIAVFVEMPPAYPGGVLLRPDEAAGFDLFRRKGSGKEGVLAAEKTAASKKRRSPSAYKARA